MPTIAHPRSEHYLAYLRKIHGPAAATMTPLAAPLGRLADSLHGISPTTRRDLALLLAMFLDCDLRGTSVFAKNFVPESGQLVVPECSGAYLAGEPVLLFRPAEEDHLAGVDASGRIGPALAPKDTDRWRLASAEETDRFFRDMPWATLRRLVTLQRCGDLLYDASQSAAEDVPF